MEDYEIRQQSTQAMSDLLSAFDDIEEGKPVPKKLPNGQIYYDNTKQIMEKETKDLLYALNDMGIEYGNLQNEGDPAYLYEQQLNNSFDDDDLSSIYGNYVPTENENYIPDPSYRPLKKSTNISEQSQSTTSSKSYIPGKNWSINETSILGMKSAKSYSIICNKTGQVLFDNIMMAESAMALMKILNEGRSLSDPKVLGIISSGIQYTNVVNAALKIAKKRQSVLKESKYDEAKELDIKIAEYKQQANELKYKVLNFLKDEGFITK